MLAVNISALIYTGQKSRLPVLRFLQWITARTHGHEPRQVLVLGSESISDPRADAGTNEPCLARVHEQEGWLVIGHIGVHGANHANVIDVLGRVGKQFADFQTALAKLLEFERRWKCCTG